MARLTHSQVIAGLVARGVPQHIAEGVAMNFRDESNFNTSIRGDAGNAIGLAQWNGPRMARLASFAQARGLPIDDPDAQLDFFMHENAGPEREAWSQVLNSSTPQEAAVKFLNLWERPAAQHASARSARYRGASADTYSPAPTNPNVGSTIDFKRAELAAAAGQPATSVGGTPQAFPDQGGYYTGKEDDDLPSFMPGGKDEPKSWLEVMGQGMVDASKANLPGSQYNRAQHPKAALAPAEQAMPPVAPVGADRQQLAMLMLQRLNSGRLF